MRVVFSLGSSSLWSAWLLTLAAITVLSSSMHGQTNQTWDGSSNTAWNTANNWTGPGGGKKAPDTAAEVAVFANATTNDPASYGTALTVGGFSLTGGEARSLVFTNTIALAQYGVKNSSAFDLSITGAGTTTLSAAQTWSVTGTGNTTFGKEILNGGRLLTLDGSSAGAGSITNVIGGTGGITKSGSGTWILSGNNIYTGTTTITAGKLVINGDQTAATGATTVSGAGTILGGSGTVGGSLTVGSGAVHAVGNGPGLQTIKGTTTYNSGSIFEWDLAANKDTSTGGVRGTDYDAVNINGALVVNSSAIFKVIQNAGVDFTTAFWQTNRAWSDIFSVTGSITGWANNTVVDIYNTSGVIQNVSAYGSFTISGATLNWSAVPEPTTALVGILLGVGLLRRRR